MIPTANFIQGNVVVWSGKPAEPLTLGAPSEGRINSIRGNTVIRTADKKGGVNE